MSVLASVRPDDQNLPLLLHVFGAMVLVGGLVAGATALGYARGEVRLLRLGYWSLLAVSLPGWVLMRVGAQWIYSEQGWDDLPEGIGEPGWLTIGATIGDLGGVVLLVALIVGGIGVSRLRAGKGSGLLRATLLLTIVLLVAYLIAAWAMAGKPG
jgi:hypothetical protein